MSTGPVTQTERIGSIDVLRGFALLGILVVNIQIMAMIGATLFNPFAYGDMSGLNRVVWIVTRVFFDQKFMTIFSALFGAGIALMSERKEAAGDRPAGVHYRRMFWLMLIGLFHGYLLWYGEILFLYSVCGFVVFLLRRLRPRTLLIVGLIVISIGSALSILTGLSVQFWPQEAVREMQLDLAPNAEMIAAEVSAYQSGWLGQMAYRAPAYFDFHTFILLLWGVWRAGGLMLIGMALFKWGFFHGRRPAGSYLKMASIGLTTGLGVVGYGVYRNFGQADHLDSFFFGGQFNYWGSLGVSLGYAALVLLWCQSSSVLAGLKRSLAAVGQMALTNYFLHTIICTLIFYGHGLGFFGQVERTGQFGIVVAIWVFQLIASPLWLRRFRFGPLEWLWRSLTYLELQPLRRVQRGPT